MADMLEIFEGEELGSRILQKVGLSRENGRIYEGLRFKVCCASTAQTRTPWWLVSEVCFVLGSYVIRETGRSDMIRFRPYDKINAQTVIPFWVDPFLRPLLNSMLPFNLNKCPL